MTAADTPAALDGARSELVSYGRQLLHDVYSATDAGAVVHTHSPEVVALSASCTELPAIHYDMARLGGPVRVVEYARTLAEAYGRARFLEWLARVYRMALGYGSPRILTTAELDEVREEMRRRRYGKATELSRPE